MEGQLGLILNDFPCIIFLFTPFTNMLFFNTVQFSLTIYYIGVDYSWCVRNSQTNNNTTQVYKRQICLWIYTPLSKLHVGPVRET